MAKITFFMKISVQKLVLVNILLFLAILYFLFHTIYGDRGIFSYVKLQQDKLQKEKQLEELTKQKNDLEHKVNLLKPETIDKDFLEEEVRVKLDYASPKEKIYYDSYLDKKE